MKYVAAVVCCLLFASVAEAGGQVQVQRVQRVNRVVVRQNVCNQHVAVVQNHHFGANVAFVNGHFVPAQPVVVVQQRGGILSRYLGLLGL